MIRILCSLCCKLVLFQVCMHAVTRASAASATSSQQQQSSQRYGQVPSTLEISYQNISSNLMNWDQDYAIMFYGKFRPCLNSWDVVDRHQLLNHSMILFLSTAPWCKYCKTLYFSWEQIAKLASKPSNGCKRFFFLL
jgi:hypothetical protein